MIDISSEFKDVQKGSLRYDICLAVCAHWPENNEELATIVFELIRSAMKLMQTKMNKEAQYKDYER